MKIKTAIKPLSLALILCASLNLPRAQTSTPNNLAPGAPGKDAQWTNAGKTAVGASNTLESKVWFTLRDGVLTEVYYPTVDVANTRLLQFVVVSSDGKRVETEEADTTHRVEATDTQALTFRQINTAKSGAYTITKTYVTDPARPTVLIDVEFKAKSGERLYVYYDPSLNNSGMHDVAWSEGRAGGGAGELARGDQALMSSDADKASALVYSPRAKELGHFGRVANGYFETSDGLLELKRKGQLAETALRAADGNVVQVAEIPADRSGIMQGALGGNDSSDTAFTLALGFGREPDEALRHARQSLLKGFVATRGEYEQGWHEYVTSLRRVEAKYQAQFDMAAMVLKAHEDKTYRGAMIASLSIPWGGGSNANEPNVGGYHLVWARDLYQVATAFYALGDKASADRALDYLFRVQQKPDGSFPQNSWLDGRPFWGSLQLDEVAFPLILAYQFGRTDNETWTKHVRPAADFIVRHGPYTPQERWEEESGYSPSTIAAEIAGLVCAAEIAKRNNDEASERVYLAAADEWARNIEAWTATTTGTLGEKNYYLRITENNNPNDGEPREINNGGGTFDEREIVDAGFLELVRLGIKPPNDPLIAKSVAVIDRTIKVETPNGASFYRYNHDGYGEMDDGRPWNWDGKYTGKGRLWALLAGERGQYELALGQTVAARRRLDAMLGFANEGGMIPEQVWDATPSPNADLRPGEGTGSATPLAWSMAQFIRLAASLQEGRNLDTPDLVAARYIKKSIPARANADFVFPADEALRQLESGKSFRVSGMMREGMRAYVIHDDERRELKPDAQGRVEFNVPVTIGDSFLLIGVVAPSGATSFQRARVRGLTPEERRKSESASHTHALLEHVKTATVAPLVEDDRVTFIYRGAAKRVEVVGDFTGWAPRGLELQDAPEANVKLRTLTFPKDARAEYKLIADGEWMLDPLNPNRNNNGVGGQNSNFAMPAYRGAAFGAQPGGLVRGTLEDLPLPGDTKRRARVYLPPGYARTKERYPALYLQDGSQYIELARAAEIADRMIAEGKLAPFIIVFIDPVDRMKEYWANDGFADFMARELVPFVDARYRTRPTREGRALLGASLGGVISVWTALRHPDMFARVGGQSSAFQIDEERALAPLAALDEAARRRYPMRFYFDVGRMESILDVNRRAQVMLAAKGYPVTYREIEAGHNYTAWRDQLGAAYVALWSK